MSKIFGVGKKASIYQRYGGLLVLHPLLQSACTPTFP